MKYKKSYNTPLNWMLWGNQISYYNTVGETQPWISFFWMQMFRLIAFFTNFGILGIMFFITTTKAAMFINFWSCLFTTIAFGCLFIGAGMQVCEQKILLQGKPLDKKEQSNLWMFGVFSYCQAIPFAVTALIIWLCNEFFDV
jgi:hypothetical protein